MDDPLLPDLPAGLTEDTIVAIDRYDNHDPKSWFNMRINNVLVSADIHTLGQLRRLTPYQLGALRNLGETSVRQIQQVLGERGVALVTDDLSRHRPARRYNIYVTDFGYKVEVVADGHERVMACGHHDERGLRIEELADRIEAVIRAWAAGPEAEKEESP
jgi:hypothetical protein